MTDRIEFKSRVNEDGTLDLHVPLGESEAGVDVIVTIRRASPAAPAGAVDPQEWHRFVQETYGSCAGLGLERQPQGEFERRETLE